MIITLQQLIDLEACDPAIRLFREQFGDRLEIDNYTPDKQEWLIRSEWRRYLGWAWAKKILPIWSLRGVNLSGFDLSGVDLRWSDFRESDFSGSDLSGSDLRESDFRESDFICSDLRRSDLRRSDLRGSDFSWSDLREADLRWSNLSCSDFSWADLSGARATSPIEGWLLVDGRLQRAEVSG